MESEPDFSNPELFQVRIWTKEKSPIRFQTKEHESETWHFKQTKRLKWILEKPILVYLEVVHNLVNGAASLPDDHGVDAGVNLHLLLHHRLELVHNLRVGWSSEKAAAATNTYWYVLLGLEITNYFIWYRYRIRYLINCFKWHAATLLLWEAGISNQGFTCSCAANLNVSTTKYLKLIRKQFCSYKI